VTGEIRSQHLLARKARESLGWKPLFTLDEGLSRSIDWYRGLFLAGT
jgi:CDP-glucose 4,6-dehydratase